MVKYVKDKVIKRNRAVELNNKQRAIFFTFLVLFVFALLSFFSISTSFLYTIYGTDSIEYKLAGAAILDGLVMFKDIFHQKGALFLFVEAIGEAFCRLFNNDKAGTFFIQYVNLLLSSCLILKIEQVYFTIIKTDRKTKNIFFFITFFSVLFFWMFLFLVGNQVEEFAVLYQLLVAYIAVKYCVDVQENDQTVFRSVNAFVLGVCVAVTFWFKPTTAVVVGACILFIGVDLLKRKSFKLFFRCIALGLAGILVVTVPLLIYYQLNGALNDMFEQCFMFNVEYINEYKDVNKSKLKIIQDVLFVYMFPIGTVIIAFLSKFSNISVLSVIVSVCNSLMLIFTSSLYIFYYVPLVSSFLLFVLSIYKIRKLKFNVLKIIVSALLVFTIALAGAKYVDTYGKYERNSYYETIIPQVEVFKKNTEKMVDKGKNNTFFVDSSVPMGSRYFYYQTEMYPFSNSFCLTFFSQCAGKNLNYYIHKFENDFKVNPPKYIVVPEDKADIDDTSEIAKIYDDVILKAETEYDKIYSDDAYTLYELKCE